MIVGFRLVLEIFVHACADEVYSADEAVNEREEERDEEEDRAEEAALRQAETRGKQDRAGKQKGFWQQKKKKRPKSRKQFKELPPDATQLAPEEEEEQQALHIEAAREETQESVALDDGLQAGGVTILLYSL